MAANEQIIDLAYERLAGAIPEGTTKHEGLRAACRLVGDILRQMSKKDFDETLFDATVGIIKCEYNIWLKANQ